MASVSNASGSKSRAAMHARAEKLGIDLSHVPTHVAIIMDGNGRWAQRKGLGRLMGHREGYLTLKSVLQSAADLGIQYLTVYGFSAENWRRPDEEVSGLMQLIANAAKTELMAMHKNGVRVRIAGRLQELPEFTRTALTECQELTKDNSGITFTLAINYGGRAEIVDAVKALIAEGKSADDIDEHAISAHVYFPDHPEPDLMIRTAGEMRWSNFLIWQSAYCELFVTDVSWPDFGDTQLLEAVKAFQSRTRKFGAL